MNNNIPKKGAEIQESLGGSVGVWAEGDKVMIKAVTKEGQPVPLTALEASTLGGMLKTFAAQIEKEKIS